MSKLIYKGTLGHAIKAIAYYGFAQLAIASIALLFVVDKNVPILFNIIFSVLFAFLGYVGFSVLIKFSDRVVQDDKN